jgi:hypothetical protein
MINDPRRNKYQVASLVNETKRLCTVGRECIVSHISRELNNVIHTLARIGHASKHTQVWFQVGPDIIRQACNLDGTPMPLSINIWAQTRTQSTDVSLRHSLINYVLAEYSCVATIFKLFSMSHKLI